MLVQVMMLVLLLVFVCLDGFLTCGAVVGFPGIFRAHGAERDQLSEIRLVAGRAFRGGGRRENQVLKTVAALPAEIFIDRHGRDWQLILFEASAILT